MENTDWMDGLFKERIMEKLDTGILGRRIILLETVDSTSSYLKGLEEAEDGTVVIARTQTGGRGRMGRRFYSPKEGGIYLSVLLRNAGTGFSADLTTVAAALSLRKALLETTGTEASLKWVNDVYLRGYKIGGILTEGTFDMKRGVLREIIIGCGVNLNTEVFPPELEDIASSVYLLTGRKQDSPAVIASLLNHLEVYLERIGDDPDSVLEEYRRHLLYLGEEITVTSYGKTLKGVLKDINEKGNLILETLDRDSGIKKDMVLSSGEISIRRTE